MIKNKNVVKYLVLAAAITSGDFIVCTNGVQALATNSTNSDSARVIIIEKDQQDTSNQKIEQKQADDTVDQKVEQTTEQQDTKVTKEARDFGVGVLVPHSNIKEESEVVISENVVNEDASSNQNSDIKRDDPQVAEANRAKAISAMHKFFEQTKDGWMQKIKRSAIVNNAKNLLGYNIEQEYVYWKDVAAELHEAMKDTKYHTLFLAREQAIVENDFAQAQKIRELTESCIKKDRELLDIVSQATKFYNVVEDKSTLKSKTESELEEVRSAKLYRKQAFDITEKLRDLVAYADMLHNSDPAEVTAMQIDVIYKKNKEIKEDLDILSKSAVENISSIKKASSIVDKLNRFLGANKLVGGNLNKFEESESK